MPNRLSCFRSLSGYHFHHYSEDDSMHTKELYAILASTCFKSLVLEI